MSSRAPTKRFVDLITILVFLSVLYGSVALTIWHRSDNFMVSEKRNRAGRPNFSLPRWLAGQWQPAAERYFNDRFGGRDLGVRSNNLLHVAAFRLSPVKMVMIGRDGQLLYAAENTIDDFRHRQLFSTAELTAIRGRVLAMRDEAASRGAEFVMIIAPNTQTIYPQTVPAAYTRLGERSRFDQVVDELQAAKVTIVDPRPELRRQASTARVYHLTDTHWNDLGGFIAYTKLIQALSSSRLHLTPKPMSDFSRREGWTQGGDLAVALSLADFFPTRSTWLVPKAPTRAKLVPVAYPEAKLVRPPKATEIDDPTLPKVVVFRDSFSKALEPLLSEHFRRVVYIRSPHTIPLVLDQERPDLVLLEIAERFLPKLVSGEEIFDVGG